MRRLLNTLYVTMPDVYLACDGENVLIKVRDEVKFRVPVHNLEGIVCFGFAGASPKLMHLCCRSAVVALSFLSEYGKFMGRGQPGMFRVMYCSDEPNTDGQMMKPASARLSRRFIAAKIINSRAVFASCVEGSPRGC